MANGIKRFGLSCAIATPFDQGGRCDLDLLAAHARRCLAAGCESLTLFGTTGEGASIGADERSAILARFKADGFDFTRQIVVCTAASAIDDAVTQMRTALDYGCRAILLPPPFYFKDVSDDGLYEWYAACFRRVGSSLHDVILYHIPSVTSVPLPLSLIERLKADFPRIVSGVKDSGGNWSYSRALLDRKLDLAVLIGDERHLAQAVPLGAQGAISGAANFMPGLLLPLVERGYEDGRVSKMVEEIVRVPVTPAVKALIAYRRGDDRWRNVAAPLRPLAKERRERLTALADELQAV
jgi:4-hydroxy-tetrahydrodipicolinate synthase